MINVNGRYLTIKEKKIELEHNIKKILQYTDQTIVLVYDNAITANNVVSLDSEGNIIWKINDILNINNPTGNVDIQKEGKKILKVYSSLGIMYRIDVQKRELIEKRFLK